MGACNERGRFDRLRFSTKAVRSHRNLSYRRQCDCMTGFLSAWSDLLWGRCCVACQRPGPLWCDACGRSSKPEPFEFSADTWVAGRWTGARRKAILAWKLGQVTELDPWCTWQLAAAIVALGPPEPFALVPVPSTRRAKRERGRSLVTELANLTAAQLRQLGVDVQVREVVRLARQTADQSQLNELQRSRNVRGAMRLSGSTGRSLVLVDDIVTTGATLGEMARVITDAGLRYEGAAAMAGACARTHAHPRLVKWSG